MVRFSYMCFLASLLLHSSKNSCKVVLMFSLYKYSKISVSCIDKWLYCKMARAAPLVGQSCLESTRTFLSTLMMLACWIIYKISVDDSMLQVKFSTIPMKRSLSFWNCESLGFLSNNWWSFDTMKINMSCSFINEAICSIQLSLAVKSSRTVAEA